jgi:hypothetical protein
VAKGRGSLPLVARCPRRAPVWPLRGRFGCPPSAALEVCRFGSLVLLLSVLTSLVLGRQEGLVGTHCLVWKPWWAICEQAARVLGMVGGPGKSLFLGSYIFHLIRFLSGSHHLDSLHPDLFQDIP